MYIHIHDKICIPEHAHTVLYRHIHVHRYTYIYIYTHIHVHIYLIIRTGVKAAGFA